MVENYVKNIKYKECMSTEYQHCLHCTKYNVRVRPAMIKNNLGVVTLPIKLKKDAKYFSEQRTCFM